MEPATNDTVKPLYIPEPMDCRTCNLCMTHCPTFKITRQMEESPQGRLRLIAKVLQQDQTLTEEETEHLNDCVECRACEKVCPSKMRYLKLLGKARVQLPERIRPATLRGLIYITRNKQRLLKLFSILRAYQRTGLQKLLKKLGVLKLTGSEKLNDLLPGFSGYQTFKEFYPSVIKKRGSVALFTGCLTDAVNNSTLHAAIKVLTYLGYDVQVPQHQQCCGAIHSHNGDRAGADQLAEQNLQAFHDVQVDAILFTASACGTPLKQYKRRKISDQAKQGLAAFESRLMDINQFIAEAEWPENMQLKTMQKQVLVHEPCSHQFPLATHKASYEYLQRIPGLNITPLPENNQCCGAGGSYMLTHPQMSESIRTEKLNHLVDSDADYLLTTNIGCAIHLESGVNQQNLSVKVMHPVALLAQQIG